MNKKTRILLVGTGEFPLPIFKKIAKSVHLDVQGIVTSPSEKNDNAIEQLESNLKVQMFKPEDINKESSQILKQTKPQIVLVCNYGQILSNKILDYPKYKCINIHASLLPKLRGACPIEMSILQGLTETGITYQIMKKELDAGDIIAQKRIDISPKETGETLHKKLKSVTVDSVEDVLLNWIRGDIKPSKQDHTKATFCSRKDVSKKSAQINWNNTATKIERKIRAFNPYPVAWTYIKTRKWKKRLKIFKANILKKETKFKSGTIEVENNSFSVQCGKNQIIPIILQIEGKQAMTSDVFLNGMKNDFVFI